MGGDRSIRVAIENLLDLHGTDRILYVNATVNSVDVDNRTCNCTAIDGKTSNEFPSVRLMSEIDDGILILPTVGSTVTIILSIFTDPIVIGYSSIDKIIFRGGDLGGLVRVKDVTTKLNNLEKFANNLQTKLNDFISKYNSHVHTGVQTGAGTSAVTAQTETPDSDSQLVQTQEGDIENTAITQG